MATLATILDVETEVETCFQSILAAAPFSLPAIASDSATDLLTPRVDVIAEVANTVLIPVAAYQVSGEYAMIESAAAHGRVDRAAAIREMLLSIRPAGASIIITYWATEAAASLLARTEY